MIELRKVTKEYSKGNAALNGISVKIERGEFVFIVGDSGSGKSTLIKLIMKELNPTEGTIIVNGQNLNRMKHRNIAKYRRGLGVVFQDFRLLKDRNIYENIAFALRVTETPTRIIKKKVPAALSLVGLAQKYKSFPKELSGGEQQRVAIARALVNEPAILLADEPTGNLDPTNSWEIMSILKEANERGTTVLVVTHNQEIVNEMNERYQEYLEEQDVFTRIHCDDVSLYLPVWIIFLDSCQLSVHHKNCRRRRCYYRVL